MRHDLGNAEPLVGVRITRAGWLVRAELRGEFFLELDNGDTLYFSGGFCGHDDRMEPEYVPVCVEYTHGTPR